MKKYLIYLLLIVLSFSFFVNIHAISQGELTLVFDKSFYFEGETIHLEVQGNGFVDYYGMQMDIDLPSELEFSTPSTPYDTSHAFLDGVNSTTLENAISNDIATLIIIKNSAPGVTIDENHVLMEIYFIAQENIYDPLSLFTITSDFDDITYGLSNFCIKLSNSSASPISYHSSITYNEYVFSLIGESEITLEAGTNYTDPGVVYNSNDHLDVTSDLEEVLVVKDYTITYHLVNDEGTVDLTLTRIIHVVDTTAPTFTLPASIMLEAEATVVDFKTYATNIYDLCDDAPIVTSSNTITNFQTVGTYSATVRVTDKYGNYTEKNITVTINDTVKPDFTVSNQTITAEEYTNVDWSSYIQNPTDNATGTLISSEVTDNVNYNVAGTYSVIVKVTDASGNYTEKTLQVTVEALPAVLYTVSFYQEDGVTLITSVEVESGDTVSAPEYSVEGYNLKGWQKNGINFDLSTPITEDTNLTALLYKNTGCFANFFGTITFDIISAVILISVVFTRKK